MTGSSVVRDERTVMVEDRSFRFALAFTTYALLLDVTYRSYVRGEAPWDLLGIVILSGAVSTAYQWRNQILNRASFRLAALTFGLSAVVAALIAMLRQSRVF